MTLQECYEALGGNYQEVSSRLPSEKFIQKFVLKFLDDQSYQLLEDSWQSGNDEEAFRAAHTIKGMCQNLSFTTLQESSSQLRNLCAAAGRRNRRGCWSRCGQTTSARRRRYDPIKKGCNSHERDNQPQ